MTKAVTADGSKPSLPLPVVYFAQNYVTNGEQAKNVEGSSISRASLMQADKSLFKSAVLRPVMYGLSVCLFQTLSTQPRLSAQVAASVNSQYTTGSPTTVAKLREVLPAESLGADDLIELSVSYCPELSKTFRVSSDGRLALPLIHTRLMVASLTPDQVKQVIEKELMEEHILADPIVDVSVVEYRSRPISVVGAVNRPLTFQATGQTSLLDALAQAGGLGSNAGGGIIVTTRQHAPEERGETQYVKHISVKDLISGTDPALNLHLEGGDEIRVPEASKVFVAGNVRHPGVYPMQGDSDTTVIKAITLSQGLDLYSSANAFIYRKSATGAERQEVKIALSRILAHKAPDVALYPDDILYVPSSDGKRLTSRVLSQLAGFGQAAGTGLIIYK